MKSRGDSLIKSVYSNDFFDKHVTWNMARSAIYNKKESGDWAANFIAEPKKYLLRYNVGLDDKHRYNKIIEFELDSNGNFIPNNYREVYGFERLDEKTKKDFQLNYDSANKIVDMK